MTNLKDCLEKILKTFPPVNRVHADPVKFQRKFYELKKSQTEIEAVALFSAMLAYGSASQFTKKIQTIVEKCNYEFLKLITEEPQKDFPWVGYRMSTAEEISIFAYSIGRVINKYSSIKNVFLEGYNKNHSTKEGLIELRNSIMAEAEKQVSPVPHGIKHLLPDPSSNGCCKRWHMFLRWMVRGEDGVDLGFWKEVPTSDLIIPLDTHIGKISRNIGLTSRKADDWKTAVEISEKLKECCKEDPIKYDFALCHLGISGKCSHGKDKELCEKCMLSEHCVYGKELNNKKK